MKIVKKIWLWIPVVLFVLIFITIINISNSIRNNKVPKVLGYSFSIVMTGSMEPDIKIGDLIVTQKKNIYNVGDYVSFYYDYDNDGKKESLTHEIIRIDGNQYTLRGIAAREDEVQIVQKEDIYGEVVAVSSSFGKFLGTDFVYYRQYVLLFIIIICVVIAFLQVIDIIKTMKKKENNS